MTDENTLVLPDEWRRALHPRRDRPDSPNPPAVDRAAARRARSLVDGVRGELEEILALPGTAPEVAGAARAHLSGDADPLGAAAVMRVAAFLARGRHGDDGERLCMQAWVAGHGVAFAAAAFVEATGLQTECDMVRSQWKWSGVRHQRPDEARVPLTRENAKWLRTHLAAAPDDVYAEAVEALAEHCGHAVGKLMAAYLAPTRDDWVEDLCADPGHVAGTARYSMDRWLLFCALGRPHQLSALGLPLEQYADDLEVLVSLVDGVGSEAVLPLLVEAVDERLSPSTVRTCLGVIAGLPLDDAFRALVDRGGRSAAPPALGAAARRFPARALRLLPESDAPHAADLLSAHVRTHPDLAETMLSTEVRRHPVAADLPPVLAEPPWTRPRKKAEPVVLEDLPALGVRATVWKPDEREAWATGAHGWRFAEGDYEERAARFGALSDREKLVLVAKGPEDLVRPLLAGWRAPTGQEVGPWMKAIVARFELDVEQAALSAAAGAPAAVADILLPLQSDEIARTMADWLVRLKATSRTARAWFGRHGLAAVPALLPDALGKAGAARRAAEAALRLLADRHGAAPIVEAARVHGDKAAAAIEALLAVDPLDEFPKKIPSVGWVETRALPQILLRDRTRALPDDAAAHVLTMLAMSKQDDTYAGVPLVREICDPVSLAEFGWALFRCWERFGAPAKESWALAQLGLTGDDDTARRITPAIRAWPGEGGHTKSMLGLDVLTAIGTDTALMHLHAISQRAKFKALKARAQEKIEKVAAGLELTSEQLADRLVPDLGLDASGTLVLDYGPRRFTIGFDEYLKPTIADEDGKLRKSLPKPGAKDAPDLAPAAVKRFAALKKDVRAVASDQLARLEQAMVTGRRWPLAEFRDLIAEHPLIRHLARRLARNRYLVVNVEPGIAVGTPDLLGDQTLAAVRLAEYPGRHWRDEQTSLRLGDLDPVTASEILADLTHLTASTRETP